MHHRVKQPPRIALKTRLFRRDRVSFGQTTASTPEWDMSESSIPPRLFELSETELYRDLGEAVVGGHAAPTDPEEVERRGYDYFDRVLPQIRARVCGSSAIASFVKKDDVFALAGAIAELITGHFALPRATGTLAVLAARMGLKALCPRDLTSGDAFLARFQTQRSAFRGIVRDDVFQLRDHSGAWEFGQDVIQNAARIFLNDDNLASRIEVALVNEASMSATWYKRSDEPDSYLIAVNAGLVTALSTIAYDVFGYGDEVEGEALLLGNTDPAAAERVAERVAAFLEIGFPLGNAVSPSPRRVPFVKALIHDALRFLVLHEFAHILLRHDRGDVHLLRNRMVGLTDSNVLDRAGAPSRPDGQHASRGNEPSSWTKIPRYGVCWPIAAFWSARSFRTIYTISSSI